uniref:Uncharacterized protein n=1 Tax=Setaria italica TaxID=4555 RepID=K4AP33_SETIT
MSTMLTVGGFRWWSVGERSSATVSSAGGRSTDENLKTLRRIGNRPEDQVEAAMVGDGNGHWMLL